MIKRFIQSGGLFLVITFLLSSSLQSQSLRNPEIEEMDQSGRRGMLIFSGYYGWWLGIALAEGWDVNLTISKGKKNISVMPLITTPVCLITTHFLTRNRSISHANTSIITLGGHLGAWQGLGWAGVADLEDKKIVQIGALAGLAGIGTGLLASKYIHFSSGGATLTHSGLIWGAWLGLVGGVLADHNHKALLSDMLIGSNLLILSLGFTMRDINISKKDVYGLNGFGYVNGALFWVAYWGYTAEKDKYDGKTGIAMAGLGSVLGLVVGAMLLDTDVKLRAGYMKTGKSAFSCSLTPQLIDNRKAFGIREIVPGLNIHILF